MADTVGYALGTPDGILTHFLDSPLKDFAAWYVETLEENPEEFSAGRLALLHRILKEGEAALGATLPQEINGLVLDYYGSYVNFNRLLKDTHDYWDKLICHQALVELFRHRGDQQTAALLAYTVQGRFPLPQPETSADWREYSLSFWTAGEVLDLRRELAPWSAEAWAALTPDEQLQHALQTTAEALDMAAAQATGLIIFVGW